MSKGNIYLGYGRGAIGDLVLSRMKGQQIGRARNRHPSNPRTSLQMRQRAGFVSPLKFYTRGVQNLFQFAFTDKRLKESDYNAFMRFNVGGGFPLTPDEFRNEGFPALGSWVMSRGQLSAPAVWDTGRHTNNLGVLMVMPSGANTIGALSKIFIDKWGFDVGDIVTFVSVLAYGVYVTATSIEFEPFTEVKWYIEQFRIDPTSTKLITDVFKIVSYNGEGNVKYFGINGGDIPPSDCAAGLALIRSKITKKGLLVSTSKLTCGGYVPDFIEFRNTPAEIQRVLAEWGANSGAILKGGLLV